MTNINMELDDKDYYDFVALKARYKVKTWPELVKALVLVSKGMKVR